MNAATHARLAQQADGAIRTLLEAANQIAMKEVERRVRYTLARHKGWSFCMAMGSASFHHKNGEVGNDDHARRWMQSVLAFINEFDRELHLTGQPMKIESADGPLTTNW